MPRFGKYLSSLYLCLGLCLFICLPLYAGDWHDFRCIIKTTITAGGRASGTLVSVACLKKEGGSWYRLHLMEPHEQEFISVIKGASRVTWFPARDTSVSTNSPEISDVNFTEFLEKHFFPGGVPANKQVGASLKNSRAGLNLPVDSIVWFRKIQGNLFQDYLTLFDSTMIPLGQLSVRYSPVEAGGRTYTMPVVMAYTGAQGNVKVVSEYDAYRIDEGIPEETFSLEP
jgi:hypothetical protein